MVEYVEGEERADSLCLSDRSARSENRNQSAADYHTLGQRENMLSDMEEIFFFQAEDGIRGRLGLEFRRVLFRSRIKYLRRAITSILNCNRSTRV